MEQVLELRLEQAQLLVQLLEGREVHHPRDLGQK